MSPYALRFSLYLFHFCSNSVLHIWRKRITVLNACAAQNVVFHKLQLWSVIRLKTENVVACPVNSSMRKSSSVRNAQNVAWEREWWQRAHQQMTRNVSRAQRYALYLKTLTDWSLGKQLILSPENLSVSRGGATKGNI